MPKKLICAVVVALATAACVPSPWKDGRIFNKVYYLSPSGSDTSGNGTATAPWQHFATAFKHIVPGDALVLLDGTYHDSIAPPSTLNGDTVKVNGVTIPRYITIGALHDGKAFIDGDGTRVPIHLSGNDYFDIEGVVAYNSSEGVVMLDTAYPDTTNRPQHDQFHRVSAYNSAATCSTPGQSVCNHQIWEIDNADNTLVEDCVGAGRGRAAVYAFESTYTTIRRCWFRDDIGTKWSLDAQEHAGFTSYMSTNTTFENNIFAEPIAVNPGETTGAHDWNNVYGGPNSLVNHDDHYYGNVLGSVWQNALATGVTQCKLSHDHVFDNNVVVQSQGATDAWRRGFANRGGKNVTLSHLTLVGDSASSAGSEQQGLWVNASVYSDQDHECSPLNSSGQHYGAWGFYKDGSSAPTQHSGFDFTMTVKDSVIQGFRVGEEAETADNTPPSITSHDNDVTGNKKSYVGLAQPGARDTNTPLTWNTAKYGKGAYLIGASNAPVGDDGKRIGAHVVYETVDGVATSKALWPFPVEDRIWNETGNPALWEGANSLFTTRHQQSPTYDGVTVNGVVRTGGWWKTLDRVYP